MYSPGSKSTSCWSSNSLIQVQWAVRFVAVTGGLCILSPETLSILKLPSKKITSSPVPLMFFQMIDRYHCGNRIISIVRWVHGGPEWKAKNIYGENYARWILRWISRRRNLGWSPVKICEPQNRLVATSWVVWRVSNMFAMLGVILWMVAKSCTTLDGWNPHKIMGCLPPINWCRISLAHPEYGGIGSPGRGHLCPRQRHLLPCGWQGLAGVALELPQRNWKDSFERLVYSRMKSWWKLWVLYGFIDFIEI